MGTQTITIEKHSISITIISNHLRFLKQTWLAFPFPTKRKCLHRNIPLDHVIYSNVTSKLIIILFITIYGDHIYEINKFNCSRWLLRKKRKRIHIFTYLRNVFVLIIYEMGKKLKSLKRFFSLNRLGSLHNVVKVNHVHWTTVHITSTMLTALWTFRVQSIWWKKNFCRTPPNYSSM